PGIRIGGLGEAVIVDAMRHMKQSVGRDVVRLIKVAIGAADTGKCVILTELPFEKLTTQKIFGRAARRTSEQMGVAAQYNRTAFPTPRQCPKATPAVAERQHGIGPPGLQTLAQRWIVESAKMMRAGIAGAVGHKFMRIPGKQIDVPHHFATELSIRFLSDAEVPQIKDAQIECVAAGDISEPRRI